jgi:hypothetical protein
MEAIEKAGINGIITGVASAMLYGPRAQVGTPFAQTKLMPLYALMFLAGAGTSLITDGLHMVLKDNVPISQKSNDRQSQITGVVINSIVFYGLIYYYDTSLARDVGALKALAVGAASEWVSSSSYTQLKEKLYI